MSYIFISLFHLHGHWHEKLTLYVSKRLFIFKGLAFLQFFFSILMKCVKSVIIKQTTNLFTLQTLLLCPNFDISTANLSFQILDLKYQFYGFLHLLSQGHNTYTIYAQIQYCCIHIIFLAAPEKVVCIHVYSICKQGFKQMFEIILVCKRKLFSKENTKEEGRNEGCNIFSVHCFYGRYPITKE